MRTDDDFGKQASWAAQALDELLAPADSIPAGPRSYTMWLHGLPRLESGPEWLRPLGGWATSDGDRSGQCWGYGVYDGALCPCGLAIGHRARKLG